MRSHYNNNLCAPHDIVRATVAGQRHSGYMGFYAKLHKLLWDAYIDGVLINIMFW